MYWLLFFASCLAFVLAFMFKGEVLTLTLPFVCTFFVLAMDII